MKKLLVLGISISLLAACGGRPIKKSKAQVYRDPKGVLYTRTHSDSDNSFIWWMYGGSDSSGGGYPWTRVTEPPTSQLSRTVMAVEMEEDGQPEPNFTAPSPNETVVDETTTEAEADAIDAASNDGASDGGSDGGSSGGDAGGGADGGGGSGGSGGGSE